MPAIKRRPRFGNATVAPESPSADSDPGNIGDPVRLQSDLDAWQAPQRLPGSPHRLPPPGSRLGYPAQTLIASAPGGAPGGAPIPQPVAVPTRSPIMDPHHYARLISGLTPNASMIATAAALNTPVVTSPGGYRNFLLIRNMAATGGGNLFVDFGQTASANSTLKLTPGQMVMFDVVVPQDDIYLFSDATAVGNSASWSYSNIAAS